MYVQRTILSRVFFPGRFPQVLSAWTGVHCHNAGDADMETGAAQRLALVAPKTCCSATGDVTYHETGPVLAVPQLPGRGGLGASRDESAGIESGRAPAATQSMMVC